MSNYSESDFGAKLKSFFSNRAAVVTVLTMVVAVAVVIAVTISASRSKAPAPGADIGIVTGTNPHAADTDANPSVKGDETLPVNKGEETLPVNRGEETLPVYHGQETLPVNGNEDAEPTFALPVNGKLFKDHNTTLQVYSATMGDYRVHLGVDITTSAEAPVFAAADGKVEKIWTDTMMGYCVAISHDQDVVTVYKNLAKDMAQGIAEGVSVQKGQQIGRIGDSAMLEMADEPHLHFEMTVGGLCVDPLDYFSKEDVAVLAQDTAFENNAVTGNGK